MEDDKTIEEIFKDVTDSNKLQYLKEKLGQVKKDKNGVSNTYPSLKFAKYLEHKDNYLNLSNKLNSLKEKVENGEIDAMTEMSISGATHIKKTENALKLWVAIGYKNEVERIISENTK
ncbi:MULTISPECIES: hypothetical protein [Flavobacterium]|uniref:Uncharacterized protein n=1 Tax=Flavobacterium hankyongi TaxID=1176532 RepID=A0ABP9A990_9FLAO|nr:hypothetical protein [Flavobacterium sp. N1846]